MKVQHQIRDILRKICSNENNCDKTQQFYIAFHNLKNWVINLKINFFETTQLTGYCLLTFRTVSDPTSFFQRTEKVFIVFSTSKGKLVIKLSRTTQIWTPVSSMPYRMVFLHLTLTRYKTSILLNTFTDFQTGIEIV